MTQGSRRAVPAKRSGSPPGWGIVWACASRHDSLMGRWVVGVALTIGLALAGAVQSASAETLTVSIANDSPDLGNILITTASAQAKVTAGTGAVSFSGGTAVRVKKNGVTPGNIPAQTVTVTCAGTGNCKKSYGIFITAVSVSGQATSIPLVNVANLTCPTVTCTTPSGTERVPTNATPIITIVSNQNSFSMSFTLGASAVLNKPGGQVASWSYNVRAQ